MIRTPAAIALMLALGWTATAHAQAPPPPPVPAPPVPMPAARPPVRPRVAYSPYGNPYYNGAQSRGYRNPGGVGRYNEYYGPSTPIYSDYGRAPVRPANFNGGSGVPDRAEQFEAQRVGIARANALQQHIDNYARPYFGYGFGLGGFGGFY